MERGSSMNVGSDILDSSQPRRSWAIILAITLFSLQLSCLGSRELLLIIWI